MKKMSEQQEVVISNLKSCAFLAQEPEPVATMQADGTMRVTGQTGVHRWEQVYDRKGRLQENEMANTMANTIETLRANRIAATTAANTADRTQADVTPESLQAYVDTICARIDAERAENPPWWMAQQTLAPVTVAMDSASAMAFA